MAEPLKNQFGPDIPERIAGMICSIYSDFNSTGFIRDSLKGYEPLGLTQRGRQIADCLYHYLPANYMEAIDILINSLGPQIDEPDHPGMAPFLYMPHVFFVAEYGLDDFEASMHAQYELTQRFTAEFSIRPFLLRYPDQTFTRLKTWATDPNVHVRRLVSEGTRSRLPWAPRIRILQKNPARVLSLLELLKDDGELYVRRSVANNLNDIGKDNPSLLTDTARRWMKDASAQRQWLIRHALRSAIKRRDKNALLVLGFGDPVKASVDSITLTPKRPLIGEKLVFTFQLKSSVHYPQAILIDYRVHFVKANGKTSPKVFKLKTINLEPYEAVDLNKSFSLVNMTTRKHYPGKHRIDIILNGEVKKLGEFQLLQQSSV